MQSITFVLKHITCGACIKVSERRIRKIAGIQDVHLIKRGSEAQGELSADRDITIAEIQQALSGTPYEVFLEPLNN